MKNQKMYEAGDKMLAAVDINNGLKMSWVRQRWDVHDGALVMLGIKLREGCEILNEPLKNIQRPFSQGPAAKQVIFLSADAFGVLPEMRRVTCAR